LYFLIALQGKEYVFVANSDNLGAVVDLSILILVLIVNFRLQDLIFVILCSGFNDENSWNLSLVACYILDLVLQKS
jgi:hypothetical protein